MTVLESGETYDTETFDGEVTGHGGAAAFLECTFDGAEMSGLRLDRARFSHCTLHEVRATDLRLVDASLLDTGLDGCRFGALDASGAELRRVRWTGGKVDYANLRSANLRDVTFSGCEFGELDLLGATVRMVRFLDCRIGRLDLTSATLTDVDLTGADLGGFDGVGGLAGATISGEQLHRLAPTFAAHLGVRIAQ
ncbi:MAG: pentapeptide repeat-containing protein [Geodermatophilaceae bacterium]|nr:pentapeptide repeat-containing protein [Geodermatophilaceae bacterium]